jgi:hypothetical protein
MGTVAGIALAGLALLGLYAALHRALDWVLRDRPDPHPLPMDRCHCQRVSMTDGLLDLTIDGRTHTRTVCHPEQS